VSDFAPGFLAGNGDLPPEVLKNGLVQFLRPQEAADGDREDPQMSAADSASIQFTSSLEVLIESAAARAVAQALEQREQDPGRSPWYTVEEAAEYARMSREAIKQARRRGQLRFDRSETGRICRPRPSVPPPPRLRGTPT
jgi:hypothetical protein